ncbi:MAG TPA: Na+/H+ antiporter NhaC family protein [Thermotogota bacterium]|nr:Na+/H+ antiporter NhaC family protein [Thermotogota bacterium]HPR95719.1 Na+/H+ antiporter NhaC family protein [Thermotogota bacterium]
MKKEKIRFALQVIFVLIIGISVSIIAKIPIYTAILFTLIFTVFATFRRGYGCKEVFRMMFYRFSRIKKTLILLTLISMATALWMETGTIPMIISASLEYLSDFNIVLIAFFTCTVISVMIGSAFGALGTVGVAFISLARGTGVELSLMAGAVIAGSFFGDVISPVSPMFNLAAEITGTEMWGNLKYKLKFSLLAAVITGIILFFTGNSHTEALGSQHTEGILRLLEENFNMGILEISPIILFVFLSLIFRKNISKALGISLTVTVLIALFKGIAPGRILISSLLGYTSQNPDISLFLSGGGLLSMVNVLLIITFSTMLNGMLQRLELIDAILDIFNHKVKSNRILKLNAAITSAVVCAITCNHSLTVMVTGYYYEKRFERHKIPRKELVHIIFDSGIILSPLIPWNANAIYSEAITTVSVFDYLPYTFPCLLLPAFVLLNIVFSKGSSKG